MWKAQVLQDYIYNPSTICYNSILHFNITVSQMGFQHKINTSRKEEKFLISYCKFCKEQSINSFIKFIEFLHMAVVIEDPDLSPKRSVGFRQKYSSVSLWRELVEPVMPALLADPSPSLPLKIPLKAFFPTSTSQGPEYAQ